MGEKLREVKLSLKDVPRLFNAYSKTQLCDRDIVAYVRGKIERNPWVVVILDTKGSPVMPEELENFQIYWKGYNDDKVSGITSISARMPCVINADELNIEEEDCGLTKLLSDFFNKYAVSFNSVLLVIDENDTEHMAAAEKLYDYILASGRNDVAFPIFFYHKKNEFANGLDLTPYIESFIESYNLNVFGYVKLENALQEIDELIRKGKTSIVGYGDNGTAMLAKLRTYLLLQYNLPALNKVTFVADYLSFPYIYCVGQLSLYERLRFIKRLPSAIGYIGTTSSFGCLAKVIKRYYPTTHYVFDIDGKRVLSQSEMKEFSLENPNLKFADYRAFFPQSKTYFTTASFRDNGSNNSLAVSGGSDAEQDAKFVLMFSDLARLVQDEQITITVKNSIIVRKDGKVYLLYCPEPFALKLGMASEYFGTMEYILPETEFYRIIDAQIQAALLSHERALTYTAGQNALVKTWRQMDVRYALQPAIPLKVSLRMHILPFASNGLSYYDKFLRCSTNIFPWTTVDDEQGKENPMLKYFTEYDLRHDSHGKFAVNCFGTMADYTSTDPTIHLTYEVFRHGGLL